MTANALNNNNNNKKKSTVNCLNKLRVSKNKQYRMKKVNNKYTHTIGSHKFEHYFMGPGLCLLKELISFSFFNTFLILTHSRFFVCANEGKD